MKWALIKNGVVSNMIVAPEEADKDQYRAGIESTIDEIVEVEDDAYVGPGFSYDGSVFTAPEPVAEAS